MIAIELPQELEQRFETLAKAHGRTAADFAREAIIEQIGDLEDLYLAEQELIEVSAGRSKSDPLADVVKQYGLED